MTERDPLDATPSLIELADAREAREHNADYVRYGGKEFENALRPEGEAARARVAERRALAADGVTLAALRAALLKFQLRDGYARSPRAAEMRAEAAGALQAAIALLTDRLAVDEEYIRKKTTWTRTDWSMPEWIAANIADLRGMIQGAQGIKERLTVDVPRWEAEIARMLARDEIAPAPGPTLDDLDERSAPQTRAISATAREDDD
jgi:hypothetical protein